MTSKNVPVKHSNAKAEAEVSYAAGVTLNVGNYESARIDVSVKLPSGSTDRALGAAFDRAKKFVQDHLDAEVRSIKE